MKNTQNQPLARVPGHERCRPGLGQLRQRPAKGSTSGTASGPPRGCGQSRRWMFCSGNESSRVSPSAGTWRGFSPSTPCPHRPGGGQGRIARRERLGEKIVFHGPGHCLNIKEGACSLAFGAREGGEPGVWGGRAEPGAVVVMCGEVCTGFPRRVHGARDRHSGGKLEFSATCRGSGGGCMGALCTRPELGCHRLTPEGTGSKPRCPISLGFIACR